MILINVSGHFELPEDTSGNCIPKVKCKHSTSEEENKQASWLIARLEEAHESNDATYATINPLTATSVKFPRTATGIYICSGRKTSLQ